MVNSWVERYQYHFLRHFGKPFDVQVYHDADGFSLKLATHDWAMRGFHVYASLGMADRLAREGEQAVGEVILYSDAADKEVPRLFVTTLFFILKNEIPLTTRFSVGFAGMNRAFSKKTGKTALYFTRAFSPDGEFDKIAELARVYQAFFITEDEDEFLEENGAIEFEHKFWSQLGEDFKRDEPLRAPVDLEEMPMFKEKVQLIWSRAAQLFSVRRSSCI
jgi:hypothetical protein